MVAAKVGSRKTTGAKVRVSPFKLVVRPQKDGFICEFYGSDGRGGRIEVELEFPEWWMEELLRKLGNFKFKRGGA